MKGILIYHWLIFGRDACGGTGSTHLSVEEVHDSITFV